MKVKFKKLTVVDYQFRFQADVREKTFNRNEVVEVDDITEDVSGYANIYLNDGDLAIGVPKNTFEVLT